MTTIIISLLITVGAVASPNLPLDRPYTLRNPEPSVVERESDRRIREGGPLSFVLPRPCAWEFDADSVCPEAGGWGYVEKRLSQSLRFSPIGGYEFRSRASGTHTLEGGLIATGTFGPVSFALDARMYSERRGDPEAPSFDREPMDRQDAEQSGTVAYSSYARYRTNVNYDGTWGRLSAGRDAAHWGPGLMGNLVFNQASVPFNQLTYTVHVGPFTLHSLYGQLAIGSDWESNTSSDTRSVYGHRYEWRPFPDLLLGVSEQLVLYNASSPFSFIPVVPLFIAKYTEKERSNNGNLAMDAAYRLTGFAQLYSEFLLDDIQSPGTLFGDHWGNKWGLLVGAHVVYPTRFSQAGAILEYARLEPWVYSHYLPNTAQSAHMDFPLGNPDGPNSQTIRLKGYLRGREGGGYLGLLAESRWKGMDPGSNLLDIHPETGPETKAFLGDDVTPELSVSPLISWRFRHAEVHLEATFGERLRLATGALFFL